MKQELAGLALTVLMLDAAAAAVSLAICAVFFGVTAVTVGSALLAAAMLLALSTSGAGTAGPLPGGVVQWPNRFVRHQDARQAELLAASTLNNTAFEQRRQANLSWALVGGIASATLFAAAVLLLVVVAE